MFALLANGPPPPYPMPDAPAIEWVVWGGCLALATFLGGWALYNLSHSKRTILAVVALLVAPTLFVSATIFVMGRTMRREDDRYLRMRQEQLEQERREIEQRSLP